MNRRLYERLIEVATAQECVYYSDIAPLVNLDMSLPPDRAEIGRLLGEVSEHEHAQGRPLLSVVVISGFIMLVGYTVYIAKERLAGALTGFVTGTLYSSTGIAGPPMAMFMVNQRWERGTFRSSLSAVNVFLEALTLVSFGASGVIGINSLGIDLLLLPVVLLSSYLATKLVARLTPNHFRKTIVYMVLITGVVGLLVHFFL